MCIRDRYWPCLQKWILALIEHNITPVVYTEGAYNTRLKYLKEVPKNKVVYHFENVDLKLAKKELGDTACLMGGFPVYSVRYGTCLLYTSPFPLFKIFWIVCHCLYCLGKRRAGCLACGLASCKKASAKIRL